MKKMLFLIALPFLLIASPAFAEPNVLGLWKVDKYYIQSDGYYDHEAPYLILIDQQIGRRFSGCMYDCNVNNPPERGQYFSGVIVGRKIYFTHWDSVTTGRVRLNGNYISFVNQVFDVDDRTSETSVGTAIKVDSDPSCDCPPIPSPPLP